MTPREVVRVVFTKTHGVVLTAQIYTEEIMDGQDQHEVVLNGQDLPRGDLGRSRSIKGDLDGPD